MHVCVFTCTNENPFVTRKYPYNAWVVSLVVYYLLVGKRALLFLRFSTYGALGLVVCCHSVYGRGCKGCWFHSSFLFINLDDIG